MIKYTMCFVKQGSNILLLNREFPAWMGFWNGIGGKIEDGETPRDSMIRELIEETGIKRFDLYYKGITFWSINRNKYGGMYTYLAVIPLDYNFLTPAKTIEGILDWKNMNWIMNPDNIGVAYNIPKSIENIVINKNPFEYQCFYENGKLVDFRFEMIEIDTEWPEKKNEVEKRIMSKYLEKAMASDN